MEPLFKTSDTPFASVLLALGYQQVDCGINQHNRRMWFAFDIDLAEAAAIQEEWDGYADTESDLDLAKVNLIFQLFKNFTRMAKGQPNDPRFTSDIWKENTTEPEYYD